MAEDPKAFLREAKSGIGESVWQNGYEHIHFYDSLDHAAQLTASGEVLRLSPESGVLVLSRGQAHRLANSLERWSHMGNFGKPNEPAPPQNQGEGDAA